MLITRRISFMQAIQNAATHGYYFYTSGNISVVKLPEFIKKIQNLYSVNQSAQQCWRRKKRGLGNAKFFVYPSETDASGYSFDWFLMISEGLHPAYESETIQDLRVRKTRLVFSNYMLVQKSSNNGRLSFTFKLTGEAYDYYLSKLRTAVRNKKISAINKVKQQIEMLSGFAGVRQQRKQIIKHYQAELKRAFKQDVDERLKSFHNFYYRRVAIQSVVNVSLYVSRMLEHNSTAKQQLKIYFNNSKRRGSHLRKASDSNVELPLFKKIMKMFVLKACLRMD